MGFDACRQVDPFSPVTSADLIIHSVGKTFNSTDEIYFQLFNDSIYGAGHLILTTCMSSLGYSIAV